MTEPVTPSPSIDTDALRAAVTEIAERHGVPGVAVGVLHGDQRAVVGVGVTNVEFPLPVDGATRFQVGSISKTITSAAVMLLVESGDVDLSEPASTYLRGLDLVGDGTGIDLGAVTVEQLLSHRSGIDGDHFLVHGGHSLEQLRDARALFAPGQGYSYSNAGFTLAGAVIEAVSGQSYEDFVRTRLFGPLGMGASTFRADDAITYGVAAPHFVYDGDAFVLRGIGWQPGWELVPIDHAAGGLISTVDDLLTWSRFQWTGTAADGSPLLSADSLARLHRPVTRESVLDEIALDWFVRDHGGLVMIGHGGVTVGYISDLMVATDAELGVVILTNATNGDGVIHEIRRWVLREIAGVEDPRPSLPAEPIEVPATLPGRYGHAFADVIVAAGDEPGTLVISEQPRTDTEGWFPPTEGEPQRATIFAEDQALVAGDGSPRILRFGVDAGAFGPVDPMARPPRAATRLTVGAPPPPARLAISGLTATPRVASPEIAVPGNSGRETTESVELCPTLVRAAGRATGRFIRHRVRTGGLEPPHPFGYWDLNPARLPIPPRPHDRPSVRRPSPQGGTWLSSRRSSLNLLCTSSTSPASRRCSPPPCPPRRPRWPVPVGPAWSPPPTSTHAC